MRMQAARFCNQPALKNAQTARATISQNAADTTIAKRNVRAHLQSRPSASPVLADRLADVDVLVVARFSRAASASRTELCVSDSTERASSASAGLDQRGLSV